MGLHQQVGWHFSKLFLDPIQPNNGYSIWKLYRQTHTMRLYFYYIQSFNQFLYQSQNPNSRTNLGTPLNPFLLSWFLLTIFSFFGHLHRNKKSRTQQLQLNYGWCITSWERITRKAHWELGVLALINNLLNLTKCSCTTSTIHLSFNRNLGILSFPWLSDLRSYLPACKFNFYLIFCYLF